MKKRVQKEDFLRSMKKENGFSSIIKTNQQMTLPNKIKITKVSH